MENTLCLEYPLCSASEQNLCFTQNSVWCPEEAHEAFTALYDLLIALNTFDQIDLTQLTLASPAVAWQGALEQGIDAYQQLESHMDNWATDLNNAVLREQEAQRERES